MDLLKKVKNELNEIDCELQSCLKCKNDHSGICVKDVYNYLKRLSTPSIGSIVRVANAGKLYITYYDMFDIMNIKPSLAAMYTDEVWPFGKYEVIAVAPHENNNERIVLCLKALNHDEVLLIDADGVEEVINHKGNN